MSEKGKSNGRKNKAATVAASPEVDIQSTVPEGDSAQTDQGVGPDKFVFKSKFRQDKVKLFEATYRRYADGTMRVASPARWAEFEYNTWSTADKEAAQKMRDKIAECDRKGVPMKVWEATEEAAQEAQSAG